MTSPGIRGRETVLAYSGGVIVSGEPAAPLVLPAAGAEKVLLRSWLAEAG
jgi:hypothetical protein